MLLHPTVEYASGIERFIKSYQKDDGSLRKISPFNIFCFTDTLIQIFVFSNHSITAHLSPGHRFPHNNHRTFRRILSHPHGNISKGINGIGVEQVSPGQGPRLQGVRPSFPFGRYRHIRRPPHCCGEWVLPFKERIGLVRSVCRLPPESFSCYFIPSRSFRENTLRHSSFDCLSDSFSHHGSPLPLS